MTLLLRPVGRRRHRGKAKYTGRNYTGRKKI